MPGFLAAEALRSTDSAANPLTLFARFFTTMASSDFQTAYPAASWRTPFAAGGNPLSTAWTSRVPHRAHPCMRRVLDSGGPSTPLAISRCTVLPSHPVDRVGILDADFLSSIPCLHFHLSTLNLTVTGFGP